MSDVWRLRKSFDFAGQAVAWDSLGEGDPVVLVHGTPFSSHIWRAIAQALARRYHVHVYDLLGYGQSAMRPGQDVSLGIQNRVLAALIEHWRINRPRIIAHDFGGATVLRAHLIDGVDYDRMLLIDPVAMRPWGSHFVAHVRDHEAAFAGVPDYIHRAILAAYIRGAVYRPIGDAELAPLMAPWLGEVGQSAFYRQIAQMDQRFTDDVQDRYGAIRCPVELLWGVEDGWIPVERGRELAQLIPSCALTLIPASGHLMQLDAPEAVVAAALIFLA